MIYQIYRKRLSTNFSVLDGVKCESNTFLIQFKHIVVFMFAFMFILSFLTQQVGTKFFDDPENDPIWLVICCSLAFLAPLYHNHLDKKKWQHLIGLYKQMQHERCLELGLPMIIRRVRVMDGSRSTRIVYYSAFLMPARFEEEFLTFRKNDRCRELVFDCPMDLDFVRQNMKECRVEEIKQSEVDHYTFRGLRPYVLIDPNAR